MKNHTIFCALFFILSNQALAQIKCQELFQQPLVLVSKKNFSPLYKEIIEKAAAVRDNIHFSEVFSKNQKPDWTAYNNIAILLETIETANLSSIEKLSLKKELAQKNEALEQELNTSLNSPEFLAAYKIHLDNNYAFFNLLEKVSEKVGIRLFPRARLDLVLTNKETIKSAEDYLKKMNADFEKDFALTGHQNLEAYRQFVENVDPESKKLLSDIQNHLFVTIQRPESARFWVPLTGFQNQRTTGGSQGSYAPQLRDSSETTYLNMEKYDETSARFKVKNSAMNINSKESGLTRPMGDLYHYGTDHWIIKKNVLEKRATWIILNSLEATRYITDIPIEKRTVLNRAIPWKYHELILPYIEKTGSFHPKRNNPIYKMNNIIKSQGSSYFEVQILGNLSIDDMSALHFKGTPPDEKMMKLLKSKNIEVYDSRGEHPVIYTGGE
jgi:hypothetical protein